METNPTNFQLIIDTLLTGDHLSAKEISQLISSQYGRSIEHYNISSILSRISDKRRSSLGHFVQRQVQDNGAFKYSLVEEALKLSPKQIYGLTLKAGQDRYLLMDALRDNPDLNKYIEVLTVEKPPEKVAPKKRKPRIKVKPKIKPKVRKTRTPSNFDERNIDLFTAKLLRQWMRSGINLNVCLAVKFDGVK